MYKNLISLVALAASLEAAPITVANASFEDLTPTAIGCGTDCVFQQGLMSGWTAAGDYGTWKPGPPTGTTAFFNSVPDGVNIGYAHGGSALTQTVFETAVAGFTYTLRVEMGTRKDVSAQAALGTIQLIVGTTVVNATGVQAPAGGWATYTATYAAVAGDTGETIRIVLGSTLGGPVLSGTLASFDNVRLDASPTTPEEPGGEVPEPASAALAALGLASVWFTQRRRSA